MATYAVGDIQGCFGTLLRLLASFGFDRRRDRLWLVGDLVNRGARSLEVLRWAVDLDQRIICVLGNHDLHLLSLAWGVGRPRATDTLDGLLAAPDRDELLAWLRQRPLLHREGDTLLVHAGLLPPWSAAQAESLARSAEAVLRGPQGPLALAGLHGRIAAPWDSPDLLTAARGTLAGMVRVRFLDAGSRMDLACKGPPQGAPEGLVPWFEAPGRKTAAQTVVFGHWSALGVLRRPNLVALDSGCYLGRLLTACRLEDRALFQEPMDPGDRP